LKIENLGYASRQLILPVFIIPVFAVQLLIPSWEVDSPFASEVGSLALDRKNESCDVEIEGTLTSINLRRYGGEDFLPIQHLLLI
jgi:hypothetical protein